MTAVFVYDRTPFVGRDDAAVGAKATVKRACTLSTIIKQIVIVLAFVALTHRVGTELATSIA